VNPAVLENLFRQQSGPWKRIALDYINLVIEAIKAYSGKIFVDVIPDGDVREKLGSRITRMQEAAYAEATAEFLRILNDERGGILQTVNHYYADTLAAIREERVRGRLQAMGLGDELMGGFNLLDVMKTVHLSNEDQSVNDVHDILKAYYKIAVKRFADNVVIQVVERHILGPDGPVRAFSPDMVNDLDERELMDIAGEKFTTSSMRNELVVKCERFQTALEIATQAGV
jgi:hypothetical protein